MATGNILDTFFYALKIKDDGVEKKLGDVEKKAKVTQQAVEGVAKNFEELGGQMRTSLEQVLPGADKVFNAISRIGMAIRDSGGASFTSRIKLPAGPSPTAVASANKPTARTGGATVNAAGQLTGITTPAPPPAGIAAQGAAAAGAAAGGAGGAAGGGAGAAGGAAGAAAAGGVVALGIAATAAAIALAGIALSVAVLTKAFLDGTEALSNSRKAARDAGVTNTQMAAAEQYAKSMRLDKNDAREAIKSISEKTQEGWVKSREFGNVFGIGNEQTQMMKKHGIRTTDSKGQLRNSTAIFEDIGKKMKGMSRDSAIAFGEFFGMTKDFATGVYENKQSLSQFAQANKESIATQAAGMVAVKNYERAQQGLKNAWDDFTILVGSKALPILTDVLNWINESVPAVEKFGDVVYGTVMLIKDTAESVFDWLKDAKTTVIDGVFGKGATAKLEEFSGNVMGTAGKVAGDLGTVAFGDRKDMYDALANYGRKSKDKVDTKDFDKEMKQNTSLNAKAANIQLEAANLMKAMTAKFALSVEEYAAMWAATTGKASGLRDSGGTTNADFRDIYKRTVGEYATSEAAVRLYGRGQPMMQQMPTQYAVGLGVTPLGIPKHAKGLSAAQSAVEATSQPVGPASSPFGGSGTLKSFGEGSKETTVQIDKIEVVTQSTDPEAVNRAIGQGLKDELRMAVNTHNDGRKA